MAVVKLKAKLTGTGELNNGKIYLEDVPSTNPDAIAIGLFSKLWTKKEFTNDNISIDVEGSLEYYLRVHAVKNTGWKFTLTNKATSKDILELSGKTGEDRDLGINVSYREGSITEAKIIEE